MSINLLTDGPNSAEIVTAITGVLGTIFLIWTLYEQRKITKIEQTNFRLKSLPKLVVTDLKMNGDVPNRVRTFSVSIKENEIKKMKKIIFSGDDSIKAVCYYFDENLILNIDYILKFEFQFQFNDYAEASVSNIETFKKIVTLTYLDVFDNEYKQTFVYKPEDTLLIQTPTYLGKN